MGRIRTIKPEFFLSEELYDLEIESGLPVRTAYSGLWCQADREGRFKWSPRKLKTQVLPYDEVDFSHVLDALKSRGFLEMYIVNDEKFGVILKFKEHQFINNKEKESLLPDPKNSSNDVELTRNEHEANASSTHGVKEGKGKERNINTNTNPSFIRKDLPSKKEEGMTKSSSPKDNNGVSTDSILDIKKNFKSYEKKIKQVMNYYNNLGLRAQQEFCSGAKRMTELNAPIPEMGSMDMNLLLIKWYDKTVENKSPQI